METELQWREKNSQNELAIALAAWKKKAMKIKHFCRQKTMIERDAVSNKNDFFFFDDPELGKI